MSAAAVSTREASATATTEATASATTPATQQAAASATSSATTPTTQPALATATSSGTAPAATATTAVLPDLAVARGPDAQVITQSAVAALGGMERFVLPGSDVIIKPNICNAYHGPEYASTTNPTVVAALVTLCLNAGAKRVRVLDYPFGGTAEKAYATSGIAEAVKAAGGQMETMSRMKFREVEIPAGRKIKKWRIYGDILDADVVINVPIAKNHGNARLTLAMKNLMGVIEDRGSFHSRGLHQCIADLNTVVRPQLTVVDAVRILVANGPTGGNLNDVRQMDTVIASADCVAADTYAANLFRMTPADVEYIRLGAEMGIGRSDLAALRIEEIQA